MLLTTVNDFFVYIQEGKTLHVEEALRQNPALARSTRKNNLGVTETALCVALENRRESYVDLLLPHCDPKATNSDGSTALMDAARNGLTASIEKLLPLSQVQKTDQYGFNALMHAVRFDQEGVVRQLIAHSDVHARTNKGATALTMATERGWSGCVEALLTHADSGQAAWQQQCTLALGLALFQAQRGIQRYWACVDLLLDTQSLPKTKKIVKSAPELSLPRQLARVEQEALRQVFQRRGPKKANKVQKQGLEEGRAEKNQETEEKAQRESHSNNSEQSSAVARKTKSAHRL